MGFSEWAHIDFDCIRNISNRGVEFITARGRIYCVPKKMIAYPDDYAPGDRDGVLSIKDSYASSRGIE